MGFTSLLLISDSEQTYKRGIFGIRGFQKASIGSNKRKCCEDGLGTKKKYGILSA